MIGGNNSNNKLLNNKNGVVLQNAAPFFMED